MTREAEHEGSQNHSATVASDGNRLLRLSASDQVISISEVASVIFALADRLGATLAACALVRRSWKDPALDELWKHLDSILPLFGLLFDIKALSLSGMQYESISSTLGVDWIKFHSYAQRVRSLSIEPDSLGLFHDNKALMVAASVDHPIGTSLLPCVQRSTVTLELGLGLSAEEAEPLFRSLQRHAPKIQELAITSSNPIDALDFLLSQWISSLPHLTKLWLPPYYHSQRVVAAAGELRELRLLKTTEHNLAFPKDDEMQMEFRPNTFPMLRIFGWNSTIERNVRLLQPSPQVEALESLCLDCTELDSRVDVPAFTRHLGHACPRLRDIHFNLIFDPWIEPLVGEPLDMDTLYGLAPCQSLAKIRISHPFTLTLNESDVHWIGTTWKKLECLVLCADINTSSHPINPWMGTSISILPLLADVLPNLTHLDYTFDQATKFGSQEIFIRYTSSET
ncbi:hypothetical protein M407DRAFT_18651 [Tulasnella calospora MUT 4182]|uniref:F-box domain-containing protein n=1 Tax=Tulasnella calospora MUT 4182 TaxID=1051891 RepID=A0A0C3QT90_9AGAM|nr:hypothetical protein M407DRAFT_18651 [Tulasnella calospora MUT 4182]